MKNTLLVVAISAALAACSSGSHLPSVDSGKADTPNKNQPSKTGTDTSKKDTSKKDTSKKDTSKKDTPKKDTPKKDTPKKDTPKKDNSKPSRTDKNIDAEQHNVQQNKLNKFVLDGKEIDLIPAGFNIGGIFTNNGGNINGDTLTKAVSGTKYKYARFGVLRPEGKDPVVFAQGVETAVNDIPKEDGIEYKGDTITYDIGETNFEKGEFTAVANFNKHEFIVHPNNDKKKLVAIIDKNSFIFKNDKGEGKGIGKFYGPQAAEMAGTYVDVSHTTAFGGKKVK